jgi:hypothetical protein
MKPQYRIHPGDVLENSIWLSGTETPEDRKRYEEDVQRSIAELADSHRVITGPVMWAEKRPGDDRVPRVPDHISGPDVRLLVAEAKVFCRLPHIAGSFLLELDGPDLRRLREITRRAHARYSPRAPVLSDAECDAVIEELGPEAAREEVRRAVDTGTVH